MTDLANYPPPPDLGSSEHLGRARLALFKAAKALRIWHAGRDGSTAGSPYTARGGEAIKHIDLALRALYDARAALVSEHRIDSEARDARIDASLAASRAMHASHTASAHQNRSAA
ncbi:hypothetical protein [Actinomadura rupiterrae]|uniref:hypothetical protein n=1 Tax=Actinomadura rupiterrae TaxID=559627 RepID=UPI0020A2BA8B|nr:hypothetical protein [Actinomadura rupiterrae]MCP2340467.1 hypothetical protein [Actinomadura rupiterrae]